MNIYLTGNDIRAIRKALRVTQSDFADSLGITAPYLSDVERGIKTPSQQLINLIKSKDIRPLGQRTDIGLRDVVADDFMAGWPPEIKAACRTVKKILESGDRDTAEALKQNIHAFEESVDRWQTNVDLKKEFSDLKREFEEFKRISQLKQNTGTD